MQHKTANTHQVDGQYIPISASHDRHSIELFGGLIALGCFLSLGSVAMSIGSWTHGTLPILAGIAGYVWRYRSHDTWRKKAISTEDIADVRRLLALANQHEIKLSRLPSPAGKMNNGELDDWAEKVNLQLETHYKGLLSQETDVLSGQVSLDSK
ncbi:hypothetical protein A3715_11380 [Oleiphilus sp. HI0009]|nr:hypothetical protein A3715_11380 [Oleiphilus sp. HI0009]